MGTTIDRPVTSYVSTQINDIIYSRDIETSIFFEDICIFTLKSIQYNTIQYNTIHYNAIQYNAVKN